MNNRPRAFAAIIKDEHILMAHEINDKKDYWTLPVGGLEVGETYEEAVVREVKEEVNLKVNVVKSLFTNIYAHGTEECFLVEVIKKGSTSTLGFDPELPKDEQNLKEVKWRLLREVKEDIQVSNVIKTLGFNV